MSPTDLRFQISARTFDELSKKMDGYSGVFANIININGVLLDRQPLTDDPNLPPFHKAVDRLSLTIDSNESGLNNQCVVLRHLDAFGRQEQSMRPFRVTKAELLDLQYLVNSAARTL